MPLSVPLNPTDDTSELSPSGPYRTVKQFGLVLLCAAWILLGLFGHDPWKANGSARVQWGARCHGIAGIYGSVGLLESVTL